MPWTRARIEHGIDDEWRFHLEERVAELRARGMSEADAMAEAQRQFGDVTELRQHFVRAEAGRVWRGDAIEWIRDVLQDLRYAIRGLSRRPGFTISAIACLAIGIGANTTMFGVVDALLLRPPTGVRDPGSVVWINIERDEPDNRPWVLNAPASQPLGVSYPDFIDFAQAPALQSVAAYSGGDRKLGRGPDARQVNMLFITHTFMPLLGASPALGRFFSADEDGDGDPRVAVLGFALWQSQLAGASNVLGKSILIDDKPYSVIGVAPRDFNGLERSTVDVYLPPGVLADLNRDPQSRPFPLSDRRFDWFSVVGRIQPGARREQLTKDLSVTYHRADAVDADRAKRHVVVASPTSLTAMPNLRQVQNATVSLWLYGVAGIVLLIACADVAGLLITRGVERRREIAVRLALGISRGRLVRLLFAESALLTACGAVTGLLVARWGGNVIRATLLSEIDAGSARLDSRALLVTLITATLTGLACGLGPALMATRPNLSAVLKLSERDGTDGRGRVGGTLLVGQVALSLVLTVGAGLFVQSLRNLDATDFGFDVRHVLFATVGDSAYTAAQADERFRELVERTRALPGVQRVALATSGPFGIMWIKPIYGHEGDWPPPRLSAVTPDFFETLGITLRRGRSFTAADDAGAERVAIVNEEMARHYWPQGDALGKCIRILGTREPCRTIVGIIHDARQGDWPGQPIQSEQPMSAYYIPFAQRDSKTSSPDRAILYVRSTGNATALTPGVRRSLQAIFPELPPSDVVAFSTSLARQFRPWRLGATMFGIFGAIALVLTIVGLYGVLAFRVSQRTHEIGVRMALGAQGADVRRLVVGQGLRLAATGTMIGVAVAFVAGHPLDRILFGISSRDPFILAAVACALLGVAVTAGYVPALRASRIDPIQALREL